MCFQLCEEELLHQPASWCQNAMDHTCVLGLPWVFQTVKRFQHGTCLGPWVRFRFVLSHNNDNNKSVLLCLQSSYILGTEGSHVVLVAGTSVGGTHCSPICFIYLVICIRSI